ncbi:MAG: tetratricopeptide repeat protein [Cyanobacteriota/Melainabacteria group bacterium]
MNFTKRFQSNQNLLKALIILLLTISGGTFLSPGFALSDEVRSMCQQAEQLINNRQFDQALSLLKKAEKLEPDAAEVHGYLGMAYQNSLKTQKAIPEYERALSIDSSMSFIKINLATCYMNLGNLEKATPLLQQFIQENPNSPMTAQAKAYLNQAGVRSNQGNLRSMVEQGQAQLNSGNARAAVATFQQVTASNSDFAPGFFYLGYALAKEGQHQQAIDAFQRALSLDPSQKESVINIASNYQSLGDIAQAINWYQRYLKENPNSTKARDIAGRVKALSDQMRQAGGGGGGQNQFQNAGANNYLVGAASGGKYFRWPPAAMPLKIYIADGTGLNGYNPFFKEALMNAFTSWAEATGNKLKMSLATSPQSANIVCNWTDNPNQIMDRGRLVEGGLTRLSGQPLPDGQNVNLGGATITILTRSRSTGQMMSQDEIIKVCLHEVGHAIGINGHSNNNADIMFFSESPSIRPVLSRRDQATAALLYINHPVQP